MVRERIGPWRYVPDAYDDEHHAWGNEDYYITVYAFRTDDGGWATSIVTDRYSDGTLRVMPTRDTLSEALADLYDFMESNPGDHLDDKVDPRPKDGGGDFDFS